MFAAMSVPAILRLGIYLGVIVAAGLMIARSLDFSVSETARHVAEFRATSISATLRPGYLAPVPNLTPKDFDPTRLVPVRVSGRAAEAEMGIAAGAQAADAAAAQPKGELFRVRVNGLNVRSGPGKDSAKIFVLGLGEEVEVAETQRNWVRIIRPDGRSGWVYAKYLVPSGQ